MSLMEIYLEKFASDEAGYTDRDVDLMEVAGDIVADAFSDEISKLSAKTYPISRAMTYMSKSPHARATLGRISSGEVVNRDIKAIRNILAQQGKSPEEAYRLAELLKKRSTSGSLGHLTKGRKRLVSRAVAEPGTPGHSLMTRRALAGRMATGKLAGSEKDLIDKVTREARKASAIERMV